MYSMGVPSSLAQRPFYSPYLFKATCRSGILFLYCSIISVQQQYRVTIGLQNSDYKEWLMKLVKDIFNAPSSQDYIFVLKGLSHRYCLLCLWLDGTAYKKKTTIMISSILYDNCPLRVQEFLYYNLIDNREPQKWLSLNCQTSVQWSHHYYCTGWYFPWLN